MTNVSICNKLLKARVAPILFLPSIEANPKKEKSKKHIKIYFCALHFLRFKCYLPSDLDCARLVSFPCSFNFCKFHHCCYFASAHKTMLEVLV